MFCQIHATNLTNKLCLHNECNMQLICQLCEFENHHKSHLKIPISRINDFLNQLKEDDHPPQEPLPKLSTIVSAQMQYIEDVEKQIALLLTPSNIHYSLKAILNNVTQLNDLEQQNRKTFLSFLSFTKQDSKKWAITINRPIISQHQETLRQIIEAQKQLLKDYYQFADQLINQQVHITYQKIQDQPPEDDDRESSLEIELPLDESEEFDLKYYRIALADRIDHFHRKLKIEDFTNQNNSDQDWEGYQQNQSNYQNYDYPYNNQQNNFMQLRPWFPSNQEVMEAFEAISQGVITNQSQKVKHAAVGRPPHQYGRPNGMPHGIPNGIPNGIPHGMPNGIPHGIPNGIPHGINFNMARNGVQTKRKRGRPRKFPGIGYHKVYKLQPVIHSSGKIKL